MATQPQVTAGGPRQLVLVAALVGVLLLIVGLLVVRPMLGGTERRSSPAGGHRRGRAGHDHAPADRPVDLGDAVGGGRGLGQGPVPAAGQRGHGGRGHRVRRDRHRRGRVGHLQHRGRHRVDRGRRRRRDGHHPRRRHQRRAPGRPGQHHRRHGQGDRRRHRLHRLRGRDASPPTTGPSTSTPSAPASSRARPRSPSARARPSSSRARIRRLVLQGGRLMGEREVLRRPERQDGYSIVELLVAVTVFALVFAAVSIGIGRALEVNRGNRNRSAAAYLAARQLEEVRARSFARSPWAGRPASYSAPAHLQRARRPTRWSRTWSGRRRGNTTTSCDVPTGPAGPRWPTSGSRSRSPGPTWAGWPR